MVPPALGPRDDAYERALRDPPFFEAVRAAHRGSWDVLDALWWASHPDDAAPSGTAAPQARVRDLQRRVFAADADAAGDPAVIGALRALESEIAREAMAIDAAVVAVRFGESRRVGAPLLVQAPAVPPQARPADSALPEPPGPVSTDRRARLRLAASLTAAVLVGVVISGQLAEAPSRDGAPPSASSSMVDDIAESSVPAGAIFDRARVATDIPPVPVPSSFDRSSLRAVWTVRWDIAGPRAEPPYFVARAAGHRVCLLAMVTDASHASTCVSSVEFAATGLRLFWTAVGAAATAAATPHPQNVVLEWTPAGRFEVQSADPARRTWPRGLCPTDLPRPC